MIPAPDDAVLLRRRDDDRRQLVRRDVAAVLGACQQFQPLEAHARAAGDVIPELKGKPEQALPVLKQMAEQGFLRSAREVLDRITKHSQADATDIAPPDAFIITCDRPIALRRLLDSLAARPHGCNSVTIIDDSRQPENQRANAQAVTDASVQEYSALRYFGAEARAELLLRLVTALPDQEQSIRFLLDRTQWGSRPTYGLARNLALLLSVGQRALILDDDILAEAHAAPAGTDTLRFGSVNDRSFAFFPNQSAMFNGTTLLDSSPLALRESALVLPVTSLGERHTAGPDALRGAHGTEWWEAPGSQVTTTQCGTWGDPGTGDKAHWVVNLREGDIRRLLAAGDSVTGTLSKRALWMGYPNTAVMRFGSISQLTGLDHRELLPPYLPVLRGEDFLFGVMLEKMAPDSAALGLPWGVPHLPVDDRGPVNFNGPTAARVSLRSMGQWLDKQPVAGADRATRLCDMAQTIDRLCHAPPAEALRQLVAELTQQHIQQLTQLRRAQTATKEGHDAEWQSYLSNAHQELVQTLTQPLDIATALNTAADQVDGRLEGLAQQGRQLAQALRAWPTICATAGELR